MEANVIAIQHLTRFLAGLGEIVNILTAPIVAALAYLAAMERFMGERYMGGGGLWRIASLMRGIWASI